MKRIDTLVIGSLQDFELYRDDIDSDEGVVFARVTGRARGAGQGGRGGPGKGRGAGKTHETLRRALEAYRPRQAAILSPYRGLAADTARMMESGVDVRTAGPMPVRTRGVDPPITEIHRSDTGFMAMLAESRHADFGEPVYLRMITSPEGGKWNKWWSVFQSCRKAGALLDSSLRRVYVAAAGSAPGIHVSITLKTDRLSTGHLLVAPNGSRLQDDLFFLGTGGTLADDSLLNQPGVYGQSDYHMMPRSTRRRLADLWREDAVISLTSEEQRFYIDILRAIGDSAGSGRGVCIEYPAA